MKTYFIELVSHISGCEVTTHSVIEAKDEEQAERLGLAMGRYNWIDCEEGISIDQCLENFLDGKYDDQLEDDSYWRHEYARTTEITEIEVEMLDRLCIYKISYELVIDSIKSKLQ